MIKITQKNMQKTREKQSKNSQKHVENSIEISTNNSIITTNTNIMIDNKSYIIQDDYQNIEVAEVVKTGKIGELLMMKKVRLIINLLLILIIIPAIIVIGAVFLGGKHYDIISIVIAILCLIPFFLSFETSRIGARELVIISIMVALSVSMRLLFAPIPAFKPISAIVIISGIAFGMESGFMVGALSALLSNIYFGQGPWTPFQMLSWGIIGVIAGFIFKRDKLPNYILLVFIAIIGGVIYSLMMDVWTVLSIGDGFSAARYLAAITTSLPFMAIYVVSNVVFLIVLARPISKVTIRMRRKYGVFE